MFSTTIGANTALYPIWKAASAPVPPGGDASVPDVTAKADTMTAIDRPSPVIGGFGQRLTPGTAAQMIAMTAGGAPSDPNDGLPLETYAVPQWYVDYGFSVPTEAGAGGNWFAENYPEAAAASEADRNEYSTLIQDHYRSVLAKHGITDAAAHYQATIADENLSESLRREMAGLVHGDARLMELMGRLGKQTAAELPASTGDAASAAPAWNGRDERLMNGRGVTDDERARYRDILENFVNTPANSADPRSFLASLSSKDRTLLAKVHSYGAMSTLDPSSMSDEEAANFILPDSLQVDLNDDGLVGVGNGGKSWRFPPPNAPQAAKDAWEEATEGMSMVDRMSLELQFMPLNIKIDENGRATAIEPGSAEWKNPFSDPDFSYRDMVASAIGGLEFSRPANDSATIDRLIGHLRRFDDILTARGVA